MGYNIKHQVTRYLMQAILFAYEMNDFSLTDNLTKNIYHFVAEKNNKSVLNIQTNITKASKKIVSICLNMQYLIFL